MTEAFRIAPPAVVAPFEYTSVVWAMILGFVVRRDIPTTGVVAGIIVIARTFLLHREKSAQQDTAE